MRVVKVFNDDWKFLKGDPSDAWTVDFSDSGWRSLALPHDWSIEGPFDQRWASATGYLPAGIAWYRKTFELPEGFESKRVSIQFDGVYCNSSVWINGHHLGSRPNGYISFRYDLTPHLNPGGHNTLAIRVDHTAFGDARWYTGSGIYRNVYLIATHAIHITQWGIFATTPVVTPDNAEVNVEVEIQNHTSSPGDCEVEHALLDASGAVVAEARDSCGIPAEQAQISNSHLRLTQPRLWSVEQPELYLLRTVIRQNGMVVDREETSIGLRTIHFDPDTGFWLNGRNLKLKGVCVHDDAGALGVAVPVNVWERRLRLLKAAGANAIRMAHNPHLPQLYDLCDRMGFLVQDEAFDEWEMGKNKWIHGWNVGEPGKDGYHAFFGEWAEADLRDMILQRRNHPSIVMWSIGNEIDYPNDPYTHEILDEGTNPQTFGRGYQLHRPHASRLGDVAKQLVAVVKRCDTTRPVTAGLAAALISNEVGLADALDIVGYNYQEYRYQDDHATYPARVIYGSENGMQWAAWQAVEAHAFISGQFLWTGIDYLGEAGRWPTRGNSAGLLDLAAFKKPEFYFRQSIWTTAPMIYIGVSDVPKGGEAVNLWSHKKAEPAWRGTAGQMIRVSCFTNCEQAELFLNGRSVGVQQLESASDHVLIWDLPFEPGTLRAHGMNQGEVVSAFELRTSGGPEKLLARADVEVLRAGAMDLAHIEVTVVDAHDVRVYDADHEVTWTIEGPGRLLGLESGDPASHEDYKARARRLFHGRMLGYVQATDQGGTVTIRLTSPGLADAVVIIRSTTCA